jgi:hypothetical protein
VSEGSTYRWHPIETVSADTGAVFFSKVLKKLSKITLHFGAVQLMELSR